MGRRKMMDHLVTANGLLVGDSRLVSTSTKVLPSNEDAYHYASAKTEKPQDPVTPPSVQMETVSPTKTLNCISDIAVNETNRENNTALISMPQRERQSEQSFVARPLPSSRAVFNRRCLSLSALDDDNREEAPSSDLEEDPSSEEKGGGRIRHVSFTNLEIRTYPVVMGDHPYCSGGCSVSLGWDFVQQKSVDVGVYESKRSPRRKLSDLRMTAEERHALLLQDGTNDAKDLRRACRKLHRARSCVSRLEGRMKRDFFHGV